MKKYVVTKPILNIRNSASDRQDDNFIGELKQGETIYLKDETIVGTTPLGGTSTIWMQDHLNRLVASEGVKLNDFNYRVNSFINEESFQKLHKGSTDYNNWLINWGFADLEIWKIWKDYNTRGEGIRVAVIDVGVNSDKNDLSNRISRQSFSLVGNPDNIKDTSEIHHGTMSAGLIGASGRLSVFGIAPKCELIIIKAGDNAIDPPQIFPAIKKAVELGAHIISMSFQYYEPIIGLSEFLATYKDKNILFVAAVGNMKAEISSIPANYEGCLSVGAYGINNNNRILHPRNNKNNTLKFLCPGMDILTCSPTQTPIKYDRSSAATAFASGAMVLVASVLKRVPTYNEILAALQSNQCTEMISSTGTFSNEEGYGVLSPNQLIKYLKANQ